MKICLNMIVKNEAHVIERSLRSAMPFITTWAICDTGSTDGTQQKIMEILKDIPGVLRERPWVHFEHNRNEALALARSTNCDYIMFLDADDMLVDDKGWGIPNISTADAICFQVKYGGLSYDRVSVIQRTSPWKWIGAIHEYIDLPGAKIIRLDDPKIMAFHEGARARDPDTYKKDAAILERLLLEDPDNRRNQYYLAQSYRDAGQYFKAFAAYKRRSEMGGWDEEVWSALHQMACMANNLRSVDDPIDRVLRLYDAAIAFRPSRAESYYNAALLARRNNDFDIAYAYASKGVPLQIPSDRLFVDVTVYQWRLLDELSVSAFYMRQFDEGFAASVKLLMKKAIIPEADFNRILLNMHSYEVQKDLK